MNRSSRERRNHGKGEKGKSREEMEEISRDAGVYR
jgi:hypothetical protein